MSDDYAEILLEILLRQRAIAASTDELACALGRFWAGEHRKRLSVSLENRNALRISDWVAA